MWRTIPLVAALGIVGCGPDYREQTLSILNVEADRWDGGADFTTTATDAYGRPVSATVEKHTLSYVLKLRSTGPDGLPKNTDDIVVRRSERHGETTISGEASKAGETIAEGVASGTIKGIKKELGFGKKDE